MTATTSNCPSWGKINGLTFSFERPGIKLFLAGVKANIIDEKIDATIKVKCAWCGREMAPKTGKFSREMQDATSHGICDRCAKSFLDDTTELICSFQ